MVGISNNTALLEVARSLGTPALTPNGGLIKRLTPLTERDSRPGTFGAAFGLGQYPLHTDTAYWLTPCRYVLLRVEGDLRRTTTLMRWSEVVEQLSANERQSMEQSLWCSGSNRRNFYCSIMFRRMGQVGFRYDPMCMRPANAAATRALPVLMNLSATCQTFEVQWQDDCAIVIDNWAALHGRGKPPVCEKSRELYRIYVK